MSVIRWIISTEQSAAPCAVQYSRVLYYSGDGELVDSSLEDGTVGLATA